MVDTVASLLAAHRSGAVTPEQTLRRTYERIRAYADPALFITLRDEEDALAEARGLAGKSRDLPLYGVPVAVKDNIDVAGLPTTVACPAFTYSPAQDATAVARLREAGAIVVGKTNLDQFATGLVGLRSPHGTPRNPINAKLIPGGSSSGSAVAVSAGLVPIGLGTDTAGSGRVPAGMTNIVGLKPSVGLVSAAGVVPACRSLDCVSVFALTTDDAFTVLSVMAGPDPRDDFSRDLALPPLTGVASPVIAVPNAEGRIFLGDKRAERAFETALELLGKLGARIEEIDIAPFLEAARLLYEGPWVAERFAAVGDFIVEHPHDTHPVTRQIISAGNKPTAAEAFRSFYRLASLRRTALEQLAGYDALMVPTIPAAYTVAEVAADPIRLNSNLGTYTNFVNLLDLAGIAVPAAIASDGTPFGVTFLAPAGHDATLAGIGRAFHALTGLPLGATDAAQPPLAAPAEQVAPNEAAIAVVGAHLSGMPLNRELSELGARLIEAVATAPDYRLFALADTTPRKPGLLRVRAGEGHPIEVEIWALPMEGFGRFVSAVAPPLSIGTLKLADGRNVKGFLVEAEAVNGARDISSFGGWRRYVAQTP